MLTFEFMDKILWCDHSNESYWAVFFSCAAHYAAKGGSNVLLSLWMIRVTTQMKATEQYLPVVLFTMLYKVVLTFEFVDKMIKCDHSNESHWAVRSCGTVYYAVQGGSNFWVCGWNIKVWPVKWKILSSTFSVVEIQQWHSLIMLLFIILTCLGITFESRLRLKPVSPTIPGR